MLLPPNNLAVDCPLYLSLYSFVDAEGAQRERPITELRREARSEAGTIGGRLDGASRAVVAEGKNPAGAASVIPHLRSAGAPAEGLRPPQAQ